MGKRKTLTKLARIASVAVAVLSVSAAPPAPPARPNIVCILADDLGIGDVQCFNPAGRIPTPAMDRLATEGMIFTDAHSSSAVCTPSRYSILTGRYGWRSRLKQGVLQGFSERLIEPGRLTLPEFLRRHGYATACIGKWHLGMDWPHAAGGSSSGGDEGTGVDWSLPIVNGPNSIGFEYFFGISASLDMPPFVYIEDDRLTQPPAARKEWGRSGPAAEDFEAESVLPTITRKAVDYISRRAPDARRGKPFFLFLALTSPHTPILPAPGWRGRSGLNAYADFVMQTDASVNDVLEALTRQGLAGDTLVLVTSDNGCSPAADIPALTARGHRPSGNFRGHKADIFEGGHRVPLIAAWPGRITPGTRSDRPVCLVDFFRTCADLLGERLPDEAAEDSVSLLPEFEGRAARGDRQAIIHHSLNGSFSLRRGNWKLILGPDSGGWSPPLPGSPESRALPAVQLYDLAADPGETDNLQASQPGVVRELTHLLEQYIADGRSTPGPSQANTGTVSILPPEDGRNLR